MQTTKLINVEGSGVVIDSRDILYKTETFEGNSRHDLYKKMNRRLFELEGEGHELVEQVMLDINTSDFAKRRYEEKLKKTKKKLNRIKKNLHV